MNNFFRLAGVVIPLLSVLSHAAGAAPEPAAATLRPDPFSDPLIRQVELRHRRAAEGDAQETKRLTLDLEKWTKEQPSNHLLQDLHARQPRCVAGAGQAHLPARRRPAAR
jgi:hypothetical protein